MAHFTGIHTKDLEGQRGKDSRDTEQYWNSITPLARAVAVYHSSQSLSASDILHFHFLRTLNQLPLPGPLNAKFLQILSFKCSLLKMSALCLFWIVRVFVKNKIKYRKKLEKI